MKTKTFLKSIALIAIFSLVSCSKKDDTNSNSSTFTSSDVATTNKMDQASNDIINVVSEQENNTYLSPTTGKGLESPNSMLSSCVTITRVPAFGTALTQGTLVTKTIDFGTTGCTLSNNNVLKGKIILSFVYNPSIGTHILNVSFSNFYHNDNLIEGTKTITRTYATSSLSNTTHHIHQVDVNLTITLSNGLQFTRTGTRTREWIQGGSTPYDTSDDIFMFTGSFTNTNTSNGNVHTNTITNPLKLDFTCINGPKITQGTISYVRPNHTAILDFGSGSCDNIATLSIDGGTPVQFNF